MKYELKADNVIVFRYTAHLSQNDYETFVNNCELNLDSITTINPVQSAFLDKFNLKTNSVMIMIQLHIRWSLAYQFGLQQIMKEPTHTFSDS